MLKAKPGGAAAGSQLAFGHTILALAPVLITFILQWLMWPFIRPYAWFLFSPAVFVSAWIGGRRLGIIATVVATLLVAYFFLPPERTFIFERPIRELGSAFAFLGTGAIFSLFHDRLKRAERGFADAKVARQAEETLHASENRFRAVFENAAVGIARVAPDGRFLEVNDRLCEMLGYRQDELLTSTFMEITHPDDLEGDLKGLRRILKGEIEVYFREKRYFRKDGAVFWANIVVSLVRHADRLPDYFVTVIEDISARKQVENKLLQSEQRLRLALRAAGLGVLEWNIPDDRTVWENERMYDLFGDPGPDGTLSKKRLITDYVCRDDVAAFEQALAEGIKSGHPLHAVYRIRRKDGEIRWVELSSTFEFAPDGSPLRMIGVLADITERKRAEAEREQLSREQIARAEAERAAETIRRLQAVVDSALTHFTLDDLFHEMLARIRELLETDSAAILLLTEDKRSLVVRAAIGFEIEAVGFHIPIGEGVVGSIVSRLTPLVVADLSATNVIDPALRQYAQSLVGAPLIVKGECIGVIHADTFRKRGFAENDVRLLQLAADRIALAIELRRLYDAQQQARHQAEEANRMKDEFLAVVSHELRSPLTAILGYTRLLRSGPADAAAIDHATAVVERNAKAQLQIIEDLLDSARISTGKLKIDLEPVDLVPLVEAALDTVRAAAESKGVTLVAKHGWAPEETLGDAVRLQQVVWNLLSNAIKFTPKDGRVELRLQRVDDYILIEVSDNGKGIEPEFLPFVFDRFRQADSSSARRFGGLGLGLALVKHLVELHGGTITATSEGAGRGSTFSVILPRRQTRRHRAPVAAFAPREVRENDALRMNETLSLEGVCVLAVDDQEDARVLLTQALSEYGANTTAVSSGTEALAFLSNPACGRWPDIIIIDIAMPDEDGYSVLKQVRALEAEQGFGAHRIPAIALTAFARSDDRLRALQVGFDMHVTKPVEPAELALSIASLTKLRNPEPRREAS